MYCKEIEREFILVKTYFHFGINSIYLKLPARKLLNHSFEIEEDFLAGHVQRFLKGERFSIEFKAFSEAELSVITPLLQNHIQTNEGKDLLTAFLMTKVVCNIMNKYKI